MTKVHFGKFLPVPSERGAFSDFYDEKVDFVDEHHQGRKCVLHGNEWSNLDPVEMNWCFSDEVKIAHTTSVFYSFYKKPLTPPRPLFIKVRTSFSRLSGSFRQFLAVFRRLSAGFRAAHCTKQKLPELFYYGV